MNVLTAVRGRRLPSLLTRPLAGLVPQRFRRTSADDAPLRPIGRYIHDGWLRRHRWLCFVFLTLFAMFYGFSFGIIGPFLLVQFTAPIVILFGILLWVLPDTDRVPDRWLGGLLTAFVFGLLCWPDYIALALPGLPWLTMIRIIGIPLSIVLLIGLASSGVIRQRMLDILSTSPWIWKPLVGFMVLSGLSIALSGSVFFSINRFVLLLYSCAAVFFASCYVFAQPGRAKRFGYIMWLIIVYCCIIGLYEAYYSKLPWAGRIPSFLKIEDPQVLRVLEGLSRAATGIYRVQSKFGHSLGMGEFFGMSMPFVLHIMFNDRRRIVKVASFLTLPLIFYIGLKADSRLAMICIFSSTLLYGFVWTYLYWRRERESLFAPAVMLAYPVMLACFVILSFAWRRLEVMVWGGGAQQMSTDSRKEQITQGMDILFRNPIGHGIGRATETLGYTAPDGTPTIDSYFLSVALEIGVIGFVVFYGMLLAAAWRAGRIALTATTEEGALMMPACLALINFIVSKSVYSQQENHPLAFVLLGLVVAISYRTRVEAPAPVASVRARPAITVVYG